MPFDLDWKGDEIPEALGQAFLEANQLMERGVVKEVESNKWPWPRATVRGQGDVVTSPRNIVDEGQFLSSYSGKPETRYSYIHTFSAEYALAVILGAVLEGGTVLPARDPFEEPLKRLPKDFDKLADSMLGRLR